MNKYIRRICLKYLQKKNKNYMDYNDKVQYLKKLGINITIINSSNKENNDICIYGRVKDKYPNLKIV